MVVVVLWWRSNQNLTWILSRSPLNNKVKQSRFRYSFWFAPYGLLPLDEPKYSNIQGSSCDQIRSPLVWNCWWKETLEEKCVVARKGHKTTAARPRLGSWCLVLILRLFFFFSRDYKWVLRMLNYSGPWKIRLRVICHVPTRPNLNTIARERAILIF